MLTLSAKSIKMVTPASLEKYSTKLTETVFGFSYVNDVYCKVDTYTEGTAKTVESKVTKASTVVPEQWRLFTDAVDKRLPPAKGEKKLKESPGVTDIPGEAAGLFVSSLYRMKDLAVKTATALPSRVYEIASNKIKEISEIESVKTVGDKISTSYATFQNDYVNPSLATASNFYENTITPFINSATSSKYYADACKKFNKAKKNAKPYINSAKKKLSELCEVWPVNVIIEKATFLKEEAYKHYDEHKRMLFRSQCSA